MAKKMALVPPELVSEYYQLTKPEVRLEDSISDLLQKNEIPDPFRVKLLSRLIPKYQKVMHPSPPEKNSDNSLGDLQKAELSNNDLDKKYEASTDEELPIRKYLEQAVPKSKRIYINPILERMKNFGYTFNKEFELVVNGKTVNHSNIVDLFSYLMKNVKNSDSAPIGSETFLNAIYFLNVPKEWIGNKNVHKHLLNSVPNTPTKTPTTRSNWSTWKEIAKSSKLQENNNVGNPSIIKASKWEKWRE